jgi:hypothetical protein
VINYFFDPFPSNGDKDAANIPETTFFGRAVARRATQVNMC